MLFAAGCGRYDSSPFTAEIDEPNYRRGKELLRQGRNPEALAEFLKVIDKRGDDAPESHLEAGILYQQHIKDPITAIYHYKKFRELKRNSPQSDLVRQRIDAATREFARTLPAQPLENQMERLDLLDKIDQLQRENVQLKDQLIGVRTQAINSPRSSSLQPPVAEVEEPAQAPLAIDTSQSPISAAPEPPLPAISVVTPTPVAPAPVPLPTPRPNQTPTPPAQTGGRRYVVQKGDSLYAIAKSQYGSATNARVQGILNANRSVLPSAGALQPGMTLIIP
ncbi:MAG: LysM peptidoglycan-binding domain-containing protein [Rariglobus sp.]|nr:LysM peptidoglycan-binding domain-containing protein [Rariglobus sp.]